MHLSAKETDYLGKYNLSTYAVIQFCMTILYFVHCSAIAVLFNHMKLPKSVVAIDGSLYKYHPKLHDMMMAWMSELAPNTQVQDSWCMDCMVHIT